MLAGSFMMLRWGFGAGLFIWENTHTHTLYYSQISNHTKRGPIYFISFGKNRHDHRTRSNDDTKRMK